MSLIVLYFSSPDFQESLLPVHPSDVLDMPVDPNEPTYCLCHQVSYGEMIGCDNPDVSPMYYYLPLISFKMKYLLLLQTVEKPASFDLRFISACQCKTHPLTFKAKSIIFHRFRIKFL